MTWIIMFQHFAAMATVDDGMSRMPFMAFLREARILSSVLRELFVAWYTDTWWWLMSERERIEKWMQ